MACPPRQAVASRAYSQEMQWASPAVVEAALQPAARGQRESGSRGAGGGLRPRRAEHEQCETDEQGH